MSAYEISVIIPVYKAEPYLRKCLDSVINQTYRNLEIILVDDGSPDNCGAICDEYATKDDRILVIHKGNGGVSSARNAGLELASGAWVGFIDSDDYIERDQYEYLLGLALRYGADIAQCGMIWEAPGQRKVLYIPSEEHCVADGRMTLPADIWSCFSHSNCCRLYSRDVLKGIRFDRGYVVGEDLLFNLQALTTARKMVFGDKAKYHYVQNMSSACNAPPSREALISFRMMLLQAEEDYFSARDDIRRFCRESLLRNNLHICSRLVCYGLSAGYPELVCEIRAEMRELWKNRFVNTDFSRKEKLKCFLIGYAWNCYKAFLPRWKKLVPRDGENR